MSNMPEAIMEISEQRKDWYLLNFELFEKSLNGEALSSLHAIRKAAIARFAELGFPTTHNEEWKYTDVSSLVQVPFKPVLRYQPVGVTRKDLDRFKFWNLKCNLLVFVDGHFSEEFSSICSKVGGVKMGSLDAALKTDTGLVERHLAQYAPYDDNAFSALSTAFLQDGAFIYIPGNVVVEEPIYLLFISTGEYVTYPRNLLIVEENSQAILIEQYVSLTKNTYFSNVVTEIVIGENTVVEHYKLQNESEQAFHIGTVYAHQDRNSNFISHVISFGSKLVRNNITAVLAGEGAEATLNGLYVTTGEQHVDNHTAIEHAKPHCTSHELYKGILAGKSRGVFNGKIIVRREAQKTDAKQTNKNLVISDDAMIDTKPQLEIFANDVKCTHGATIGQLDDDAIFYLRTRGIELDAARDILLYAFVSEVIERMRVEPVQLKLHTMLHDKLAQGRP